MVNPGEQVVWHVGETATNMTDFDLTTLPSATLFAIARNESTEPRYRKAAVRLLLEAKSPQVNHPDLVLILQDVRADKAAEDDVVAIVEQAVEAPLDARNRSVGDELSKGSDDELYDDGKRPGALKASFTTRNM